MVNGYTGATAPDDIPWYWPPLLDAPSRWVRDQLGHLVDTRHHPGLLRTDQQYGVQPYHVRHLRDRAVSPAVAVARRYRSTYWVDEVRAYMIGMDKDRRPVRNKIEPGEGSGMLIPIRTIDGRSPYHEYRADFPAETTNRKTGKRTIKKYRRPFGCGNVLDVHPFVRERLLTTKDPIFITEGVMKGDSLVSLGACAISLFGVSGWRGKVHDPNPDYNDNGEVIQRTGPLDDLAKIPMTGREVFIVFDSDVMVKKSVHDALRNLWNFLLGRGAIVYAIYLPTEPDGDQKIGVDDYIASHPGITVAGLMACGTDQLREVDETPSAEDLRAEIEKQARRLKINRMARQLDAAENWRPPPAELSTSLTVALAKPREAIRHRVSRLIGLKHNASLTGQYKTGKTTFYCGLARSLADGSDFLGTLPVQPAVRRVGFWNCEMDEDDFLDYIQTVGIMNTDKIELLHLRGQPVRLLTDQGMEWAINWLIDNDVEIWLNDSWARLCAWSDVDENDNSGVGRLTSIIDEIKKQTKITEQFITTAHTGRVKQPEGEERARGATALDDWVDSRMVLTREGENRFLFAEGRGKVEMLETKLIFDPATNLSRIGEGDRRTTREVGDVNTVVEIVTASPGMNTRDLTDAVRQRIPSHNQDHASKAISTAKRLGLVHTVDGKNNAKLFYPGPDPAQAAQQEWTP